MSKQLNQAGFTLVELMIATSIFSVILLIALVGFVQVGRMYYRGLSATRTQEASRAIMDDISREIQFGSSAVEKRVSGSDPDLQTMCIGNKRYAFKLNKRLVETPADASETDHALQKDAPGSGSLGCPIVHGQGDLHEPVELLSENMRLAKFSAEPVDAERQLWRVEVKVVFGEDDLLEGQSGGDFANAYCKGATFIGGQFCAVSELSTIVYRRLK